MTSVGPSGSGFVDVNPHPYMQVLTTIPPTAFFNYTAPYGSGGSQVVTNAALTAYPYTSVKNSDGTQAAISTFMTAGNIVLDMGKTVQASGSTFRKIQLLVSTGTVLSYPATTGAQGAPTNYLTGYVLSDTSNPQDANVARLARLAY